MDKKFWIIGLAIVAVFEAQLLMVQFAHNQLMKAELDIMRQARAIDNDELREALHHLAQAKDEQRVDDVKSFVAGVAAAVANPEKYGEVWHAGYDRGSAVQQYATQREIEAAYTSEKTAK